MTKRILYLGLNPSYFQAQHKTETVHYPIIQILPYPFNDPIVQTSLASFSSYTDVIITSKSSISILIDYLSLFGLTMQEWKNKRTLAIGRSSAQMLEKVGITPQMIAQEETSEGMIEELKRNVFSSPFFFWPHSKHSRPLISQFLEKKKWKWKECVLYETCPVFPSPLPDLKEFDEIIFTSPSTIDAFLIGFGALPTHLTLTSIGPITEFHLNKKINLEKIHTS